VWRSIGVIADLLNVKIGPAVEHLQAPRRNLGRSEPEGAKSNQTMENQERHRPADLPWP
jgi:hypothetical protein